MDTRYKTRWEIEKVFDETKPKLAEKKSWATTPTAKAMQARFVAIVHNLLLLVQDWQQQHDGENTAEIQRREKRQAAQETELKKTGKTLPLIYTVLQRFTQATFKLIRWLRVHWHQPTSLHQALSQPTFTPSATAFSWLYSMTRFCWKKPKVYLHGVAVRLMSEASKYSSTCRQRL